MEYQLGLCNVWWGENDVDIRYLKDDDAKYSYFTEKINSNGEWGNPVNFNFTNNVTPSVTFKSSTTNIENVLKYNYAVLKHTYSDGKTTYTDYRYFFIKNVTYRGSYVFSLDLSLDDWTTNGGVLDTCLLKINRAHVNRFKTKPVEIAGEKYVEFDNTEKSLLFLQENLPTPSKRLTKRTRLTMAPDVNLISKIGKMNEWLANNIIAWEYVYVVQNHDYKVKNSVTNAETTLRLQPLYYKLNNFISGKEVHPTVNSGCLKGVLCCLCVPIYANETPDHKENGNVIKAQVSADVKINISRKSLNDFLVANSNNTFVIARKLSIRPPFPIRQYLAKDSADYMANYPHSYFIDDNNDIIFNAVTSGDDNASETQPLIEKGLHVLRTGNSLADTGTTYPVGIFYVTYDINEVFNVDFDTTTEKYTYFKDYLKSQSYIFDKKLKFSVKLLKGSGYNAVDLEPKLLNNEYYEPTITSNGQNYAYNYLKLGTETNKVRYTEALTPDITRGYARFNDLSGLYIPETADNLTGLVTSEDNSLMVDNDQLSAMLANNKNYYLQNAISLGTQAVGNVASMASGNIMGGALGLLGGVASSANIALSLDNMRSAPNAVNNANGNAYQSAMISAPALYLEEYDILNADKKALVNYFDVFGYRVEQFDAMSNYLGRRLYNYFEIDLSATPVLRTSPTTKLSQIEIDRLRERVKSIRLWNVDYTGEGLNYLENMESFIYDIQT